MVLLKRRLTELRKKLLKTIIDEYALFYLTKN